MAEKLLLSVDIDESHLDTLREQRRAHPPTDTLTDPVSRIATELGSAADVAIWPARTPQEPHRVTYVPMDGTLEAGVPIDAAGVSRLFDGLFPTGSDIPRTRALRNSSTRTELSTALQQGRGINLAAPIMLR